MLKRTYEGWWGNWTNRKPNWRKICKPFCPFKCRKVIPVFQVSERWCRPLWKIEKMAVAPQKRILEQNSQLPTPLKFGSAITENGKNGHSSPKTHPRVKLPITDPPKVWVFGFQVSTEMQNWCQSLQKMGKMAVTPQKCILEWNFQVPSLGLPPAKVWVSGFPSVDGNAKLVSAIMENGKNGCSSPKMHPRVKLPITDQHSVLEVMQS